MARKNIDFEAIIAKGEHPAGFTAQGPNGTTKWKGTGWNDQYNWTRDEVEPDKTRPAGRSNRTGE